MNILVNTSTNSVSVEVNGDLNAEQLQQLVADLGNARAQITKATERPIGPQMVVVGPGFWTSWDITKRPDFQLSLTHPGLGWVNFALPALTVEGIKIYLDQYLTAVRCVSTTSSVVDTTGGGGVLH